MKKKKRITRETKNEGRKRKFRELFDFNDDILV